MDEPSAEARRVLAAYRRARTADPAVHARVRDRIAGSIDVRTRRDASRTGQAIAVGLLIAAAIVLLVAAVLTGSSTSERELGRAPSSAQRDVPAKPELPAHTQPPPAELPAAPAVVEQPEVPVDPIAPSRPAAPPRGVSSPMDADLERELALLRTAKDLRSAGDNAKSLAVLATHAREFPRGQLAEERDAIAIEIRCKTAERPRARRELEAFATARPSSTHLARLRRACE